MKICAVMEPFKDEWGRVDANKYIEKIVDKLDDQVTFHIIIGGDIPNSLKNRQNIHTIKIPKKFLNSFILFHLIFLPLALFKLLALKKRYNFDAFTNFSGHIFSGFVITLASLISKTKVIIRVSGDTVKFTELNLTKRSKFFGKPTPNKMAVNILRYVEKFVARHASKIIVVSEKGKKIMLDAGAEKSKIHVINQGVDTEKFSPSLNAHVMRERFKIGDSRVVLYVGRYTPEKGTTYLVQAIPQVLESFEKVKFLFIASGPLKKEIEREILRHGISEKVIRLGFVEPDEINKYYSIADVVVFPSISEDLPTVILEAMSSGKAVIATKVGGIPKLITDGIDGILIDPADPVILGDAIIQVLKNGNLRTTLGENAREKIEEKYRLERSVEKYKNLLLTTTEGN